MPVIPAYFDYASKTIGVGEPILLTDGHLMVSASPQDGFLHQRSPLDTLGLDEPESDCTEFKGE